MSNFQVYIRKNNSIYNKTFNIKEKNNDLEKYLGNIIKNKAKNEKSLKKNFSYSRLVSDNSNKLSKAKTSTNFININIKKNSFSSISKNINKSINSNNINYLSKQSSMKYLKISPIIKPIYNRTYFTPKSNTQITNNDIKIKNINLEKIIKDTKIEDKNNIDGDGRAPSSDRQSQIINKIENMPIHILNNINIINNNLINKDNKKKDDKSIVFIKKRIPSCGKKSLSKSKNESLINNENENSNNMDKDFINNNINDSQNSEKIKIKKKINNNTQNIGDSNIYIKNNNKLNNNNINYYSHKFHCNKICKSKNIFNKASYKQNKTKINIEEIHKNIFVDIRNKYKKDFNTATNNNNSINKINTNIYEQTKIAFKELNLEDFLLIIQKFEDIRKNIKHLNSLSSINKEQNFISSKKLVEKSHFNQIKLYDLFRFYMGSSFDGIPEKLFSSKRSKFYLHCYSIIFILSIGTLYTILQNIKTIKEKYQDILKLINIQEKIFLLFCDLIIQKLNKKYNQNIWVEQILDVLNNKLIFNINNHFIQIKTLTLESYEIINNLLISISNLGSKRNKYISKYQEKYLYDNYYQKNIEYFSKIEINQMEEDFNQNIFKSINLKNNNTNISYFQRSITTNNNNCKEFNLNNTNNLNNNNKNYYSNNNNEYIPINNKIKKYSFNKIYNEPNQNIIHNYTNTNNIKTNNNINYNNYTFNKFNNKSKNLSIPNKNTKRNNIYSNKIQIYDIKIPDTEIIIPQVTIPFLNFHTNKKYTLIIDLDETMANFKFTNIQKGIGKLFIRPFLDNFLEVIKDYYEIIAFTSATRDYADIALDIIEKNKRKKFFDGRLYREHTTQFGKKYIKDLSKIGRDLGKIIIVDNLSQCFKLHSENGILISSFYGEDENDNALIELQKILIKIYYDNCDVRKSIYKYKDEIFNNISKSKMDYS